MVFFKDSNSSQTFERIYSSTIIPSYPFIYTFHLFHIQNTLPVFIDNSFTRVRVSPHRRNHDHQRVHAMFTIQTSSCFVFVPSTSERNKVVGYCIANNVGRVEEKQPCSFVSVSAYPSSDALSAGHVNRQKESSRYSPSEDR